MSKATGNAVESRNALLAVCLQANPHDDFDTLGAFIEYLRPGTVIIILAGKQNKTGFKGSYVVIKLIYPPSGGLARRLQKPVAVQVKSFTGCSSQGPTNINLDLKFGEGIQVIPNTL